MKYLHALFTWYILTNYNIDFISPEYYSQANCISAAHEIERQYRSTYKKHYSDFKAICKNINPTEYEYRQEEPE